MSDMMALYTPISEDHIFPKAGDITREHRGECWVRSPCALDKLLVFIEAKSKGKFEAIQIEIGVRRGGVAPPKAKVDVFHRIDHEVVYRVMAIKVEFREIDAPHVIDSSEDELGKEFPTG